VREQVTVGFFWFLFFRGTAGATCRSQPQALGFGEPGSVWTCLRGAVLASAARCLLPCGAPAREPGLGGVSTSLLCSPRRRLPAEPGRGCERDPDAGRCTRGSGGRERHQRVQGARRSWGSGEGQGQGNFIRLWANISYFSVRLRLGRELERCRGGVCPCQSGGREQRVRQQPLIPLGAARASTPHPSSAQSSKPEQSKAEP